MKLDILPKVLLCFLVLLSLTSCGQPSSNRDPSEAISAYLLALVNKDVNQMINRSCAAWEAQAQQEFDSFAAVTANLDQVNCQMTGQEGDTRLVTCTGKIIANYGNEVLEINLGDRTYQVIDEGGEWRMCGYR